MLALPLSCNARPSTRPRLSASDSDSAVPAWQRQHQQQHGIHNDRGEWNRGSGSGSGRASEEGQQRRWRRHMNIYLAMQGVLPVLLVRSCAAAVQHVPGAAATANQHPLCKAPAAAGTWTVRLYNARCRMCRIRAVHAVQNSC
jgi:hypothetical protein